MSPSRFLPARLVLEIALRADPWRAVGTLGTGVTSSLGHALTAYWLKVLIDGVIQRRSGAALLGAMAIGLTSVALTAGNRVGATWSAVLHEKAGFVIDQRLMELSGGSRSTVHHEEPDYVQRLELLRSERGVFAGSIAAVVATVSIVVWMATSMWLLVTVHPVLVLLSLFALPSLVLSSRSTEKRQQAKEATTDDTRVARHLFQLATGPAAAKEVRVFGLADELIGRHGRACQHDDVVRRRADLRAAVTTAWGWTAYAVGYLGARLFVVLRAVQQPDQTSVGDVLMVFNLSRQVNGMAERAAATLSWLADSLRAADRLRWLEASTGRSTVGAPPPAAVPPRLLHGMDLVGVSFRYPGTEVDVLRDVNLHLPAGATVAVVGENGTGKTTLVKLLCGFYQPTQGLISIDGVVLGHLDIEEWRRRVSGCFQDYARFEFLARETVGVGELPWIDDVVRVEAALARANAEDLSPALVNGLDTQLGPSFDSGVQLSSGQWQKLALARAGMREPLLLVLDEPSANLDAPSEHALFEGYGSAARRACETGAITVLVSHRFSTVRMADVIVVLDRGGVAEVGTHAELMRQPKLYAELYRLQASGYR